MIWTQPIVAPAASARRGSNVRLLADCGNTSIKLARWPAGRAPELLPPCDPTPLALERLLGPSSQFDELICIPVSASHTATLGEWWGERPMRRLGHELRAPDFGQYPTCGLDRVCAGLAAVKRHGPCVVVDAGTAVTVSVWQADAEHLPKFGGGMIIPGPRACLHGLIDLAPALPHPQIEVIPEDPLQHTTDGALQSPFGCYHEWIQACTSRVTAACGLQCLVASGDAGEWLPDARCEHGLAVLGLAEWIILND